MIGVITIVVIVQYKASQLKVMEFKSNYSGTVENIQFDDKHDARILILNSWRFMGFYGPEFNHYIHIGDSICKEKNSVFLKSYRKNENLVIEEKKFHLE